MRRNIFAWATLAAATSMLLGGHANAVEFSATFSGFEEIGGLGAGETGAIFSQGKAKLDLDLNRSARTIAFNLTYSGLSAPVTQAHIHFGKEHVAGGVMVFFCSNLAGHLFTINWTVISHSGVMDKCEPSRRNHSRG